MHERSFKVSTTPWPTTQRIILASQPRQKSGRYLEESAQKQLLNRLRNSLIKKLKRKSLQSCLKTADALLSNTVVQTLHLVRILSLIRTMFIYRLKLLQAPCLSLGSSHVIVQSRLQKSQRQYRTLHLPLYLQK